VILDEMSAAREKNCVEVKEVREQKLVEILQLSRLAEQQENFATNVEIRPPRVPALQQASP
jgi:hypothetical protein